MKITQAMIDEVAGLSSREAALKLSGIYGFTVGKSTINDARRRVRDGVPTPEPPLEARVMKMRVLAIDIENSPNVAHVWGLWDQNVSLSQLRESAHTISFAARWLDSDETVFYSVHHDGKDAMLRAAWDLLNEADVVMGWNSRGFDAKHLNREFIEAGILPPSPWRDLDLMLEVKKVFRFPSNKLDYVAGALGVGHKVQNRGHELWILCMAGDDEAWEEMKTYNIQDVDLLIDLYNKLQPWIKGHPAVGLYIGEEYGCPNCGSTKLSRRGFSYTGASVFQRFHCSDCGAWSRAARRVATTALRGN
jgi:DNA polymerase elongation subunit (family B)